MPQRVAFLSLHSHRDRSFIDDQRLASWSGVLRDEGLGSDVVSAVLDPALGLADPALDAIVAALGDYDVVVIDRVWDARLVAALRRAVPATFVSCPTEHRTETPADWICFDAEEAALPMLVRYLRGELPGPPATSRRIGNGLGLPTPPPLPVGPPPTRFAPDLKRRNVTPERGSGPRTFSVVGNAGCPYQADARDNPLYAGVELPADRGRGCAFCTTGNSYAAEPPARTAERVLEQLRYVRREAPELRLIVLKDQNPFAYLPEVLGALADEGAGPFDLLLETRADWFLRSGSRFDRALASARAAGVRLAPFLVGIENFSQPELDRLNKGVDAATNERFLAALRDWQARVPDALTLEHCSFGFMLFTPWTTLADLRTNLEAIRRTRFDAFRGSVLVSRARLYPDTALFHLARRDGLVDPPRGEAGPDGDPDVHTDSDRRYGYHEAHPWRFREPAVAHFAALATECSERTGHRDQVSLLAALLEAFETAGAGFRALTAEAILARLETPAPRAAAAAAGAPDPAFAERLRRLAHPLDLDGFDGGWRLDALVRDPPLLRLRFAHPEEPGFEVEIAAGDAPAYARSRHYAIRHRSPSLGGAQLRALDTFCRAVKRNDP